MSILELNKSNHISTLFSCEGHKRNDSAYIYFNVDEIGWDIFWLKIIPEISYNFLKPIPEGLLYLSWEVQVSDNEYNTGISIHCNLKNGTFRNWKEKKEIFWNILKEVFLKNYK